MYVWLLAPENLNEGSYIYINGPYVAQSMAHQSSS